MGRILAYIRARLNAAIAARALRLHVHAERRREINCVSAGLRADAFRD